jgi:hypothetical protein
MILPCPDRESVSLNEKIFSSPKLINNDAYNNTLNRVSNRFNKNYWIFTKIDIRLIITSYDTCEYHLR